jgi:uncharacterized Rmd1/YagE family protein
MQCKTFCSADSYQMNLLYKFFKKSNDKTLSFRNVVYTPIADGYAFLFAYGCVVFWGVDDKEVSQVLKKIHSFEIDHLNKNSSDFYEIVEGNVNKMHQNDIFLNKEAGIMERLAISHALAQSRKLAVFEERVEHTIKKTEHIPKSLATSGKITLSGKEIAQKMGKLFLERSSINLHSDILDTPEFFWDHPELESLYHLSSQNQDIKQRVDILNKRLKLIHELFEMLNDVINHRHSSRLEVIIIVLITIEVILSVIFHIAK